MSRSWALAVFALALAPVLASADKFCRGPQRYPEAYSHFYRGNFNSPGNRYGYSYGDPIERGIRSGALSRNEARELREDQWDIRRKEIAYWRDGYLSNKERRDLRDDMHDFRKDLHHELNDGERRRWSW